MIKTKMKKKDLTGLELISERLWGLHMLSVHSPKERWNCGRRILWPL